jgi:glycosyltransferase involved in cell wall biosynthesis
MRLAYLMNSYPMTSTTFIRREIEAIEAQGQPVHRFAVRHWDEKLVEPDDVSEQRRTEYLLTGKAPLLIGSALLELMTNPLRLIRMLPLWWHVYRAAGSGFVRHVGYLLQAIRFRRRAASLRIGHVHAHFSTNAATVAMLAGALGGPAYSFTVHGPDELVEPAQNALARKVERAAFVVAITGYARTRTEREAPGSSSKVRIIHCGLDLADYPFEKDPAPAARFVCVGRLCTNKGQTLIPAAVAAVREQFPDILVELIGDGEDRPLVEAEARRHGVERHIRTLGWGTADMVRDRIRASRALLLPSFAEGLPIVLMEALALGRPVITTNIAGIPELVDERCGWIFPPGSVEEIAAALRAALAASPERLAALAQEGRRRVEARHDIQRSAEALLAEFEASAAAHVG